jgi:hypothetical protein
LTIARLEAGRFTPHPEPMPPADLFRSVHENLPGVFAARPVTISVDRHCADAYVDPSLALEILVRRATTPSAPPTAARAWPRSACICPTS